MKSFGDGFKSGAFGSGILTAQLCGVHDLRHAGECRVLELEFAQKDFKSAEAFVVGELQFRMARQVERNSLLTGRGGEHIFLLDKKKFRLGIEEPANQPRTRGAITFNILSGA